MLLAKKDFNPYLKKIAVSLSYITGSSSKLKSSLSRSSLKRFGGYNKDRSLQDTISESRTNANLQPLNKGIGKPLDFPASKIKTKKNMKMSHLKDKRLFDYDKPKRNNLRSFSRNSIPIKKSVI